MVSHCPIWNAPAQQTKSSTFEGTHCCGRGRPHAGAHLDAARDSLSFTRVEERVGERRRVKKVCCGKLKCPSPRASLRGEGVPSGAVFGCARAPGRPQIFDASEKSRCYSANTSDENLRPAQCFATSKGNKCLVHLS